MFVQPGTWPVVFGLWVTLAALGALTYALALVVGIAFAMLLVWGFALLGGVLFERYIWRD